MSEQSAFLSALDLPCPPMLETVLGYPGDARYVAFYWEPSGDEFRWHTGWSSADGAWSGWQAFADHPRCFRLLHQWHFGDSDTRAVHWLLLDRLNRTWAVGRAQHVYDILRRWNPEPDDPAFTSQAEV